MSLWDEQRRKAKGDHGAGPPTCARCHRPRVYSPCRDCATPAELARTFSATSRGHPTELPYYPPLPLRETQR